MLVLAFPAPPPRLATGTCNGVTNQLTQTGNVQPNLRRAAAEQGAEPITTLQVERAAWSSCAAVLDHIAAVDGTIALGGRLA